MHFELSGRKYFLKLLTIERKPSRSHRLSRVLRFYQDSLYTLVYYYFKLCDVIKLCSFLSGLNRGKPDRNTKIESFLFSETKSIYIHYIYSFPRTCFMVIPVLYLHCCDFTTAHVTYSVHISDKNGKVG
jgi:hypothetical protein